MGRVAVRPPGRLLPLLLLLALLSGCAGGGAASASEDEEPQAPLLMEHGCLSMDLDGDGAEEAVRLYALQAADDLPPEALPPEGSDSRNLLFRWYVEAQIGDDLVTCDLNGRYYYYSPQQDQPLFFSIQDRQGASLVVAGLIPQSNGAGAGMLEVHVLSYDKGAFQVLELPLWSIQSVQAGMTAQITVPETGTVETVVLLSHKKADSYIHIDVEFGEGEGKIPVDSIAKRAEAYKPKEKVTYKMIKEYIEAKYGFKVHTAYIAEVKRDLGLPMYDAPNAVEELKQPRKHPTPEKVEAIKDALRYFAVI